MADGNKADGDKRNLYNPSFMREISNSLDKKFWEGGYKDQSRVRAGVHWVWHVGAGCLTFNKNEFVRAGEQWDTVCRPQGPPR